MMYNKLSLWLREHNFFLKTGTGERVTHLCLDGGQLNIPQDYHNEFLDMYKECFSNEEEKYYICEVPTEVSRMYVDMDFISETKIKLNEIVRMVKRIQETVSEYYEPKTIIICTTKSIRIEKNNKKMVKTGIHLIWPELYVKNLTALKLSKLFVKSMTSKFGEREAYNPWNDVIDSNVYNQKLPSLRMIGSRKVKREGGDIVDVGRAYIPTDVIDERGNHVSITKKDLPNYIGKSFIRVYEGETQWLKDIENIAQVNSVNTMDKKIKLANADELCSVVEDFITSRGIEPWEDITVRSVIKETSFYIIKVSDSMYCMNKQAEHASCGIYFIVHKDGMKQKCFCKCDTTENRLHGICSEYASEPFKLTKELKDKLFKDTKSKKNVYSGYNPDNSFPSFGLIKSSPDKFESMLANTINYLTKLSE